MENASKALIMAGAILIAIVIISLAILIFSNFSGAVKENTDLTDQEISQFNGKIIPYLGENVSGSQVNALIQTVRTINQTAIQEGSTDKRIEITYPAENGSDCKLDKDNTFSGISRKVKTGVYYKVEANYGTNGLINSIKVDNK